LYYVIKRKKNSRMGGGRGGGRGITRGEGTILSRGREPMRNRSLRVVKGKKRVWAEKSGGGGVHEGEGISSFLKKKRGGI